MKKKIAYVIGAMVAILIVIVIVLVLNNQKYVVTFDMQNGEPKFEQLVKRGNRVYEPSDPKNEGYIFLGWYEGNELYDFTKVVKYNMTLVAKWEKDDYVKVSFETVGGNTIEPISVKKGSKVTRPIDPKKTGHTFKEWTLNGEAFNFETPITEDITLLATYEDVYSVHFDSNGGSEVTSGTVKGGKIAKPEVPTRKGYKFLGWYLEDKAYDFNTEVKDNMTLKAKWLLENAYIKSRALGANSKLIGLSSEIISDEFITYPVWSLDYSINKVIVGATKPTTGVVKSEDWSSSKDNSVKAYIVKSGTECNLLIAAEDPRTIINLPSNSSYLFADLFADSITFNSNVNSKNVTNMAYMFSFSASNINLKNLNTSNVTNMSGMFSLFTDNPNYWPEVLIEDRRIEKLFHQREPYVMTTIQGIENLNISKVKDMSNMFTSQWFNSLDLSKWNTENVNDMSYMFAGINANKLDLSNFKMAKVQNDENMFGYSEDINADTENCNRSAVFYNTKINTIVNKNSDLTDARIKELFTKFSCSSRT